jgi:hypothetical protein
MKKLSTLLIIAFALVLGLSQCKKKNVDTIATPNNLGKTVYITVNVGGDKHTVNPGTGAVVYTDHDIIYVGDGKKYLGSLEYENGKFSGNITEPEVGDYLYFYFLGGLTLDSPSAGTTSYTVSIANQSSKLPVLSFGRSTSTYTDENATYGCTLLNKCGLVKFTTATEISAPITVGGMKTEATIDFANAGITPTETTGTVTLYSESNSVKWAILLPQDAVDDATVDVGEYSGTCNVPKITNNMFYTTGVSMTMSSAVGISISPNKKVRFAPGNLRATNTTANSTSGWTWSFAPTQYSIIGNATANTAVRDNYVTTPGTVDLFGWVGASSSLAAYGINNNDVSSSYGNTVNEALKSDWCVVANAANLGGHNNWCTLTKDEWEWVLGPRDGANPGTNCRESSTVNNVKNARFAKAYLFGSVHGVILFPDNYTHPEGVAAPTGVNVAGNTSWEGNQYNATDWGKMEAVGCVFLPAAGYRNGYSVTSVGSHGFYWSSTGSSESFAYCVDFGSDNLFPQGQNSRRFGVSVRLARVVE